MGVIQLLLLSIAIIVFSWSDALSKLQRDATLALHDRVAALDMQEYLAKVFESAELRQAIAIKNASMICLASGTNCDFPNAAGTEQEFRDIIYIPRLESKDLVFFDEALSASLSLDTSFKQCLGAGTGVSGGCVFRPKVQWRPVCTVGSLCQSPPVEVRVTVEIINTNQGRSIRPKVKLINIAMF